MREELLKLLNNSYAPYSKYRVATICIMKDNCHIEGVNVENASYGATICAERVALTSAISKGYHKGDFREIHIMVDSIKLGSPCFQCRQVMSELCSPDTRIVFYSKTMQKNFTLQELCPYPFGEEML